MNHFSTISSYETRLMRVMDYIAANPAGDLSLDALADVAAMSRFHWHRVFRAMTGETCAQAVRRLRMFRAAGLLVQTAQGIPEIAVLVGYSDEQSFARAFRRQFSCTPVRFRAEGVVPKSGGHTYNKEASMSDVTLTIAPSRRLIGLPHIGSYNGVNFEKLTAIANARKLWPHVLETVGLYYDDPASIPEAELRSFAGFAVASEMPVPEGLSEHIIPATPIAQYTLKGPYSGLAAAYDHLYGTWLPASGHTPADHPSYEIFENSPHNTVPADLVTHICLPLV